MKFKFNDKCRPCTENGIFSDIEFDTRFSIDRTYFYENLFFKYRFRIVKYSNLPKDTYKIYINRLLKFKFYFKIPLKYKFKYQKINIFIAKLLFTEIDVCLTSKQIYERYNYKIETLKTKRKDKLNNILNEF